MKNIFSNQNGFIHFFVLIFLLAGIAVGVWLVQTKTNLFPKAYNVANLTLTDSSGIKLPEKISDPNIYLFLKLPQNWELPVGEGPLTKNSFVKAAYAQSESVPTPVPMIVPDTATSQVETSLSVNSFCSGPHGVYNEGHVDVDININIDGVLPQNKHIWVTIKDEQTGMIGYLARNLSSDLNAKLHGSFQSIIVNPEASASAEFKFIPDGRTYTVNTYQAAYYSLPDLSKPLSSESFSNNCTFLYPPENKHTLKEIIIENNDEDQSAGGSQSIHVTSGFKEYLNKPFIWRLNSLKVDQHQAQRNVKVTFLDESSEAVDSYTQSIDLGYAILSENDVIPVDIVIDKNYQNFREVEDWAKDTINNYVNNKLQAGGIKRKVKFNISFVDDVQSCGIFWIPKSVTEDKIIVYINNDLRSWDLRRSWARPLQKSVCLASFDKEGINSKSILTHELGHILGLPDYYLQEIYNYNDQVDYSIGIEPFIKDIMYDQDIYFDFNPNSREMVNRLLNPLPQDFNYWKYYTPKQVILQVLDNNGLPLPQVKVEIFPAIYDWTEGSEYVHRFIPNNASMDTVTDNTGRVFLGDQANIFNHKKYPYAGTTGVALVRVTNKSEVRYGALSMSYLNSLYFNQDQVGTATIHAPFSQLAQDYKDGTYQIIEPFNQINIKKPIIVIPDKTSEAEKHLYTELKAAGELDKHKAPN